MFRHILVVSLSVAWAELVKDWKASLITPSKPEFYKVVFEWEHDSTEAVVVNANNPLDDPRCSGSSDETAKDGQPYWMPRFYPRKVSSEIKAQTGIQFASVDWQPCGHKDIAICHGESHYDFHLYYVPEDELAGMSMCDIGTKANPKLPVCLDSPNPANRAYFNLINDNMPVAAKMGPMGARSHEMLDKKLNFCVDESSAILRSGVHYGDKSETLDEWKTPVTIIGSHDCRMLFFEPMISWKWISGGLKEKGNWPTHQVSDIKYNRKAFDALPHSWSVNVSAGCEVGNNTSPCRIQVTVEGTKCPKGGCALQRECANATVLNCATGSGYASTSKAGKGAAGAASASTYFASLAVVVFLPLIF